MALKINKELTSRDGGKIESGSIVTFQTIIPPLANEIHFDIFVFRDEACVKDQSVGPIFPKEIVKFGIVSKIAVSEIKKLTYGNFIEILRAELESIPEIGNCIEVIDLCEITENKIQPTKLEVPVPENVKPKIEKSEVKAPKAPIKKIAQKKSVSKPKKVITKKTGKK